MTILWLTSALTSCLLRSRADQSRLSPPVQRWQHWQGECFHRRLSWRAVSEMCCWVICIFGLIDTPVFNSSHQTSINTKLQLACTKKKKSVNNLPVLAVNVLRCMLWSEMEKSCKCLVTLWLYCLHSYQEYITTNLLAIILKKWINIWYNMNKKQAFECFY